MEKHDVSMTLFFFINVFGTDTIFFFFVLAGQCMCVCVYERDERERGSFVLNYLLSFGTTHLWPSELKSKMYVKLKKRIVAFIFWAITFFFPSFFFTPNTQTLSQFLLLLIFWSLYNYSLSFFNGLIAYLPDQYLSVI